MTHKQIMQQVLEANKLSGMNALTDEQKEFAQCLLLFALQAGTQQGLRLEDVQDSLGVVYRLFKIHIHESPKKEAKSERKT